LIEKENGGSKGTGAESAPVLIGVDGSQRFRRMIFATFYRHLLMDLHSKQQRFKFAPDDKIMDIDRSLYPSKDWPDAFEFEMFSKNMKREYDFDLAEVPDPDVTLGHLFTMARNFSLTQTR
jgi:hypothetical protein